MLKTFIFLAAGIATALPTHAETAEETSVSFGRPDCGTWVRLGRPIDRAWLMGYLSGVNRRHDIAEASPANPLVLLDSADQAFVWMDNWCKQNPLENVGDGAMRLFVELVNKKK